LAALLLAGKPAEPIIAALDLAPETPLVSPSEGAAGAGAEAAKP
jgi:hypothetical protein